MTKLAWRDPALDDMEYWGLTPEQQIYHLKRLAAYGLRLAEKRLERARKAKENGK